MIMTYFKILFLYTHEQIEKILEIYSSSLSRNSVPAVPECKPISELNTLTGFLVSTCKHVGATRCRMLLQNVGTYQRTTRHYRQEDKNQHRRQENVRAQSTTTFAHLWWHIRLMRAQIYSDVHRTANLNPAWEMNFYGHFCCNSQ